MPPTILHTTILGFIHTIIASQYTSIFFIQESHSQRTYAETQRIFPQHGSSSTFIKYPSLETPSRLRLYRLRTFQLTHSSSRPPRDLSLGSAGPPQYPYNKDTVSSSPPPSTRPRYHRRAEEVREVHWGTRIWGRCNTRDVRRKRRCRVRTLTRCKSEQVREGMRIVKWNFWYSIIPAVCISEQLFTGGMTYRVFEGELFSEHSLICDFDDGLGTSFSNEETDIEESCHCFGTNGFFWWDVG